ncbi:MAG: type II toxin-antitoxin system VapC family toxin [Tardiphaga sp.]|nr:type II toxin-antitoxin system VapC family toxin [Tardiphaga sp.]
MILPDTSVWIDHLRGGDKTMAYLLRREDLLLHAFVIGELALGHLPRPTETLASLQLQLQAPVVAPSEILSFIAKHQLAGAGLGYVDVHLLASVSITTNARLWTLDKRLYAVANRLALVVTP